MARPRDPSIDRKVVEACVELLAESGRAGLSRAKIADRAGVSLPAVNRRYATIDEILVEVARAPGRPGQVTDLTEATSLRDHLVSRLTALARTFAADPVRRPAAEMLAAAAGNAPVDEAFRATLTDLRTEGLTWVERARVTGEVGPDVDGDLLLDLVTGGAYYRLLWRGEAITESEVASVVDLVLAGARA